MLQFQNLTGPFCSHVKKNVSNICSSKTYYINHLTHKNYTISSTGQRIIYLQVVNRQISFLLRIWHGWYCTVEQVWKCSTVCCWMENKVYSYTFLMPMIEHRYHTYQQETRLSSCFHDSMKHTQTRIIRKHYHSNLALYYFMQKMLYCLFHSEISQRFVSPLLKIKDLYKVCKTHAHIWSWSAQPMPTSDHDLHNPCPHLIMICTTHAHIWSWSTQTQCTSSQPISLSFLSHTTHYCVNVYYLAVSFELQYRT